MKEVKYDINGSKIIVRREAEEEGITITDAIIKSLLFKLNEEREKYNQQEIKKNAS